MKFLSKIRIGLNGWIFEYGKYFIKVVLEKLMYYIMYKIEYI